ncbi:hypothetical protein MMC14_002600 [Varicellaria rhodocarpa]|nr:hypothetical protein [Varicellaria rhodocarpa]
MVKEMLEDDTWSSPGSHSPLLDKESEARANMMPESLPNTSSSALNRSTPTFDYPAPSNSLENDESDPTELVIRQGAYKVARDARYCPMEDGPRRPGVVKKKIKMRKRKPK